MQSLAPLIDRSSVKCVLVRSNVSFKSNGFDINKYHPKVGVF